jgi:arginase
MPRNLRVTSGLEPALPIPYIVLGAVRDTDPLEQELIDRSEVERISVDDIRKRSEKIHAQMERLSSLVDRIYIHIDMDVLDPREVQGHPLTVPDGPTSEELGSALREMFRAETAALECFDAVRRGQDGLSEAAYNLIRGAVEGGAGGSWRPGPAPLKRWSSRRPGARRARCDVIVAVREQVMVSSSRFSFIWTASRGLI